LELAGREVVITNPDKPFFPQAGHTKLHLVRYYAAVAEGALRGIAGRTVSVRKGAKGQRVATLYFRDPPLHIVTRNLMTATHSQSAKGLRAPIGAMFEA
jgi:DNA primase